ncbi:STAS domain-containing protein [Streptomyces sp. HPF1205]|uniref:STAS domain-containing protein n=1 Tax=Streptomyces sp. HPF1205 TaxID=2873262 RepID=UPI001CEC8965|nr:STAS domain-containing protein [Streptomyces sp. HPF1205]
MTEQPPTAFTLAVSREGATLTVRVNGDLDFGTSDDLTETVDEQLAAGPPPRDVRLDFSGLTWIDSSGLSALLTVHRRTGAVGATLHLDNRPEVLRRMLDLTDVLGYLTAPPAGGPATAAGHEDRLPEPGGS